MPQFDQLFGSLQAVSWRGLSFPVASLDLDVEQDHVEHRFPDRDGAHVEATGRAPLRFRAKAIFRNNVFPGPAEKWPQGSLYPVQFRLFLDAAADRTTGDFVHAELGKIPCKLKSARVRWDASSRDGVDVDCEWVESTDSPDDLTKVLVASSPASAATGAAQDLDTYKGANTPPGFVENTFEPSFADAMRQIQGVSDQYSLLNKKIGGQIDHVIYRVNAMSDSVSAAKDVTLWPVRASVEKMKSALADLKKQLLTSNRTVRLYQTTTPVTLPMLSALLIAPIADLLKLNSQLALSVAVPPFTFVRYYAPS